MSLLVLVKSDVPLLSAFSSHPFSPLSFFYLIDLGNCAVIASCVNGISMTDAITHTPPPFNQAEEDDHHTHEDTHGKRKEVVTASIALPSTTAPHASHAIHHQHQHQQHNQHHHHHHAKYIDPNPPPMHAMRHSAAASAKFDPKDVGDPHFFTDLSEHTPEDSTKIIAQSARHQQQRQADPRGLFDKYYQEWQLVKEPGTYISPRPVPPMASWKKFAAKKKIDPKDKKGMALAAKEKEEKAKAKAAAATAAAESVGGGAGAAVAADDDDEDEEENAGKYKITLPTDEAHLYYIAEMSAWRLRRTFGPPLNWLREQYRKTKNKSIKVYNIIYIKYNFIIFLLILISSFFKLIYLRCCVLFLLQAPLQNSLVVTSDRYSIFGSALFGALFGGAMSINRKLVTARDLFEYIFAKVKKDVDRINAAKMEEYLALKKQEAVEAANSLAATAAGVKGGGVVAKRPGMFMEYIYTARVCIHLYIYIYRLHNIRFLPTLTN